MTELEYEAFCNFHDNFDAFADWTTTPSQHVIDVLGMKMVRCPVFDSDDRATVASWMLWRVAFVSDVTIMSVHVNLRRAEYTRNLVSDLMRAMPETIRPGVVRFSRDVIEFDNGSRIFFTSTQRDCFRGRSITDVVVDGLDPDSIKYRDLFTTIMPCMMHSTSRKIITLTDVEK